MTVTRPVRPYGFGVSTRREGDQLIVEPYGELDIATGPRLEHAVASALAPGITLVSVELEGISFIDLVGARAVRKCEDLARQHGATFCVGLGRPQTRRLFALCGLLERWDRD